MSMQVMEHANGQDANDSRDTMYLLGGAALVVFGAGLIMTSPIIRRYLGGIGVGNLLQAAAPSLDRYMKMRAM